MKAAMFRLAVCSLLFPGVILAGTNATIARAQRPALVQSVTVPMILDCKAAAALPGGVAKLTADGLCGYGTGAGIKPAVTGNCGTLTYLLFNNGGGSAESVVQITSTWGEMETAQYTANWRNLTDGVGPVVYGDAKEMAGTSWTDQLPLNTGAGSIFGQVTYAESLTPDGPCFGLTPISKGTVVTGS